MALQYSQQNNNSEGSMSVLVPVDQKSGKFIAENIYTVAHAEMLPDIRIETGFLIYSPSLMRTTRVLHPFYVRVRRVDGEIAATSGISDIYELGETVKEAVLNYLYSLVDEVVWFDDNQASLSEPMLKDFNRLQFYLALE
jgi:hypothetical protein